MLTYIEDIKGLRVDMNFIFECSTRYLTSERSEQVRCGVEHEKIKFISTSKHVIFCLLYKHNNNDVLDNFPISDHFPKISEDLDRRLVSSVGRASVCCAGGRGFEP